MRDKKGRFTHGHPCLNDRDTITGQFVAKQKDEYKQVRAAVDVLLEGADKG